MSFGDGFAQSIGKIGSTVISYLSNGTATVNSTVVDNDDNKIYISPLNDSDLHFNKSIIVDGDIEINKILVNAQEVNVFNGIRGNITLLGNKDKADGAVTVFISQWIPSSAIMKATSQVIDPNDNNRYIIPYLVMDNTRINSKSACSLFETMPVKTTHKIRFCGDLRVANPKKLTYYGVEKSVIVHDIDEGRTNVFNNFVLVENGVANSKASSTIIQPVSVNVEDYKPPTTGGATSSGEGLKGFRIVFQKFSYYEQSLSFTDCSVKDILGLPLGMVFENGYLKGSPLVSGDFPITLKLDNNTSLSGLMVVTPLPREL